MIKNNIASRFKISDHGFGTSLILIVLTIILIIGAGIVIFKKQNSNNNTPNTNLNTTEKDEGQIKEIIKKDICGIGEGNPSVGKITIYQQFASANANCTVDSGGGPGAQYILKKTNDVWSKISRSQDSCISLSLKNDFGLTEEIRSNLFDASRSDMKFCNN